MSLMHCIVFVESGLKIYLYSLFNIVKRYKQEIKLSPHAFKVYFFTVIVGSGKTQILEILVTFSARFRSSYIPAGGKIGNAFD